MFELLMKLLPVWDKKHRLLDRARWALEVAHEQLEAAKRLVIHRQEQVAKAHRRVAELITWMEAEGGSLYCTRDSAREEQEDSCVPQRVSLYKKSLRS